MKEMNRFGNDRFGGGGGGSRRPFQRSTPPVNVGEELDVTIEAVGEKGDGIAKKNGFVLFVPGVKEGQRVHIKVTKVLSKVGFAEVVGEAQTPAESEQTESTDGASNEEPQEEKSSSAEDSEDFGEDIPEDQPDAEGIESTSDDSEGQDVQEEE